jgi:ketosteroid isomerase-like protein
MQGRKRFVAFALIVISAIAARSASAQSSDSEAITATHQAFYAALSSRDIKAMEAVWANKPYVVNIGPRSKTALVGYAKAVTKYWLEAFEFFAQISASSTSIAQVHSDGKTGWVIGTESATLQPKSGGDPLKFDTFVTNIFEKEGDHWLMISHHAQIIPK